MSVQPGPRELSDRHAKEARAALEGRLGLISSYAKAQVHATLAVY